MKGKSDKPWGSFAIFGKQSGYSHFKSVEVKGGSLASFNFLSFKGMFDVYGARGVRLEDCRFGQNFLGDDAVNLAQTHVDISKCRWENARSDGLDLDKCEGRIVECEFDSCGNDGLDVSTSELKVEDCTFGANGDKGFSVGERSNVILKRSRFVSNDRGLQVKDDSRVSAEKCYFDKNRLAIQVNRKKWLFRKGGHLQLKGCELNGPRPILVDTHSDVTKEGVSYRPESP